jgi:3-deoxy-D-manno-octulosonic-acid transferase
MIRFLYNLLFPIGLLFFLPGYLLKMMRRGNYREKFGQRLGLYHDNVRARLAGQRVTWMHAVSVGEVAVALKLAARLKQLDENFFCALTTTTTTGFAFAAKNSRPWMEVMYNPIDFWPVMRRAFGVIHPAQIILIEAEVWPNLVAAARARGVPIALANARLSPRSERWFQTFKFVVAPIFHQLDLVCVPEAQDVARWHALDVPERRITATGNIKYDTEESKSDTNGPRDFLKAIGINDEREVIFGGSTHAGEEEILTEIFLELRWEFPALFLVLAPRHVERIRNLRAQLEKRSLGVALRSETAGDRPDCLLIDTTGELRDLYSIATVVFIGKSLTARGGQNPVEPILAGKPVIFGPHMENFGSLAQSLVRHHAAVQVKDAESLQREIACLLRDVEKRTRLVTNAAKVLAAHRGATAATAELLMKLRSRA